MGNYLPIRSPFQRQGSGDVEHFSAGDATTYQFPPITKSGRYFANHFVMAGEKFESMNQETFLFGENTDLNYLPKKPTTFPYEMANANQPSDTIRCFVHMRKDSLKLVKEDDVAGSEDTDVYRVEFVFDADLDCAVRLYSMAKEEFTNGTVLYHSRNADLVSEPVFFSKGIKQTFSGKTFPIKPTDFTPSELNYIPGNSTEIPLVIQITVEDQDFLGQSESTLAGIETLSEGNFAIKFLKQKIMVDGICLMTQEIYGIENKSRERRTDDEAESTEDNSECIICFTNLRDTIMLPCRHLCLCSLCGEQMRTKQSRCPICRANFHALLQVKAVRKKVQAAQDVTSGAETLEEIPLIEALNGVLQLEGEPLDGIKSRSGSSRSRRSTKKGSRASLKSLRNKSTKDENKKNVDETAKEDKKTKELHVLVADQTNDVPEAEEKTNAHVDASLPGTPMGSNDSTDSLSASMSGSTNMLLASGTSFISIRAQITTPINARIVQDRPGTSTDVPIDREVPQEMV